MRKQRGITVSCIQVKELGEDNENDKGFDLNQINYKNLKSLGGTKKEIDKIRNDMKEFFDGIPD